MVIQNSQVNFDKRNDNNTKAGGLTLLGFKTSVKVIVMKTVYCWDKHKQTAQSNRIESSEKDIQVVS